MTEAAASIRPLAWELPYAASVALKRQKKKTTCSRTLFSFPVQALIYFAMFLSGQLIKLLVKLSDKALRKHKFCSMSPLEKLDHGARQVTLVSVCSP